MEEGEKEEKEEEEKGDDYHELGRPNKGMGVEK